MQSPPRPSLLTYLAAALLAAPTLLCLIACLGVAGWFLFSPSAVGAMSGPAVLGAMLFPVPLGVLLVLEYYAIVRSSLNATECVAGVFLWVAGAGLIGWVAGLLSLLKVLPSNHEWRSWVDLGFYSAFLVYCGIVGLGHFQWRQKLRASKPAEKTELDD